MKRRRTAAYDPFFGWGTLALKTAEMLAASAVVIPHRTRRRNQPAQLFEMGNEKVQAAIEASHAMTRQWMRMGTHSGPAQWAALWSSGVTPFHRRAVSNARRVTSRRR
jgi:hypothetical protein